MEAKILIVEDNFIASDELKDRLHALGYKTCETAFSGEEAIAQAAVFEPDLVLMDINLGEGMDGVEAAGHIQDAGGTAVIYVTAYDDDATLKRAKVTSPYAYLLKPFDERELAITIDIALYRQKMERALRENEAKYRLLSENTSDGVALIEDGRVTYISSSYQRMLGYSDKELDGVTVENYLSFIYYEDRPIVQKIVLAALERGETGYSYEYRVQAKSGAYKWLEDKVDTEYEALGRPVRTIIHTRDISERKRAEAEQEKLIEQLQHALTQVKTLKQLLPICSSCKKIRDDEGYWHQLEVYINRHVDVEFSHGICPDCMEVLYPQLYEK